MSFQTPGDTGPARPGLPLTGQRRRLALSGLKGQVARGRDFTRQALADWNWPAGQDPHGQSTADDVLLVVSELLANACLHAGGPHELVLTASADGLRVEVLDGDSTVPVLRSPYEPGRPGGHGLHIVQKLADRWGVTPVQGGKSVWLEFAAGRLSA
ncbi:anti-sigma regulatory factor (Ser/Thr protein kinase) [Kitasatospora herbaricolor]|uniref:ATP-binding protein n=1 Tax=Kitasatospora herbaricolor TaxID=68217 RepID=UPI00174969DB|nr:ATP-binding protein [Kitasatospora herbaricolor]MDQ0313093.1 anti-sigma regulatory factor (Ser/Thr protein kinase) [Kitasatospora herbaricolor]